MVLYGFVLLGFLALLSSLLLLFQRSAYAGAICLLAVLLQAAGLFLLLGARLLGFLQVLIYAGAVLVLVVIALMAAPPALGPSRWAKLSLPGWILALPALALFLELAVLALSATQGSGPLPQIDPSMERAVAALLFGRFALLTEAAGGLVLLCSLAVVLDPG